MLLHCSAKQSDSTVAALHSARRSAARKEGDQMTAFGLLTILAIGCVIRTIHKMNDPL